MGLKFVYKATNGSILSLRHRKNFLFKRVFPEKKLIAFKTTNFLRANNLKFIIKKKLNLRREKTFFYSVHIAAPRKKTKKWSLFALKNIYYKKISLFFGFKKIASFLKLYEQVKASWGKNESILFLFLECRLENFLFRLNFFPSIYFIKRFILSNNIFVNNKKINYSSSGLMNGLSNGISALTPVIIGALISSTGSYTSGLMYLVGMGLLGSFCTLSLALQRY